MEKIENDVSELIQRMISCESLLQKSPVSILIACSGGRDSMALLDLLYRLRNPYTLHLAVVYVNHNLRGKESEKEEEFLRKQLSEVYSLPLFVKQVDPKFWTNLKAESIESAAREIRYQFFYEILLREEAQFIATAHNFNDRIETFFLNLLRGGGSDTLLSIPLFHKKVIRPLLSTDREEIDRYVASRNLAYVEDSTNQQNIYKRNIVRNRVFPVLRELSGDIISAFNATFHSLEQDEEYFEETVTRELNSMLIYSDPEKYCIDKQLFHNRHSAVKSRIIKKIVYRLSMEGTLNRKIFETIMGDNRIFIKKGGLIIESKNKYIWFHREVKKMKEKFLQEPSHFVQNQLVVSGGAGKLLLRELTEKDFMNLSKGKVNLYKRLQERGIPVSIAKTGFVICTEKGTVAAYYVAGFFEVSPDFYLEKNEIGTRIVRVCFENCKLGETLAPYS